MQQKTKQGHVLWTPETCPHHEHGVLYRLAINGRCLVCDGGLSICSLCGMAEADLDKPCPGKREEVANDR